MLWLASSPISIWRSSSPRLQTDHTQSTVSRWFHDARLFGRLRFRKLRKQNGVALIRLPWSYLRLKAYSFFWLCEGAYGAFGGSVLDDSTQGLTH
jgi:hypothetical protein